MDYIGMCRCEGHGFHAVYSGIGYINQRGGSRVHETGQLVEDQIGKFNFTKLSQKATQA